MMPLFINTPITSNISNHLEEDGSFFKKNRDLDGRRNFLRLLVLSAAGGALPLRTMAQAVQDRVGAVPKEPKFDVVSIRPSLPGGGESVALGYGPDGYRAKNQSIWTTIMVAYYPLSNHYWDPGKLVGGPKWLGDKYDIDAKISPENLTAWQHQGVKNTMLRSMLQDTLRDRFRLALHTATVEGPIYQLTIAKHGLKGMTQTKEGEVFPANSRQFSSLEGRAIPSAGDLRFFGTSMDSLAAFFTGPSDLPVFNATRLSGLYDFTLSRTAKEEDSTHMDPIPYRIADLGLELKRTRGPIPMLIIDHIEKPTPN